jgi:hypothetical protein
MKKIRYTQVYQFVCNIYNGDNTSTKMAKIDLKGHAIRVKISFHVCLIINLTSVTLVCSLRNNMFELADRLVGIYKTDNCTKSITINPGSFAESMEAV